MTRTESGHWSNRIDIRLTRVPCVRLSQTKHIAAPGAQKAVPEPQWNSQLSIVPGMTAPVVMPNMTRRGIGMHEITKLPEAIPVTRVHLLRVKSEHRIEAIFDSLLESCRAVGHAPDSEDARRVNVRGRCRQ